jgi:NADPH:quinone reductase and related Zn-dependent oxidoreductases
MRGREDFHQAPRPDVLEHIEPRLIDNPLPAGDITRPGSNAELLTVDERVVGPMPTALGFAEAASLPLTAITAWELLFDRLRVHEADPTESRAIVVVGAASGVGSILTQLARRLTGPTMIGNASRPATRDWVLTHGAHHVIDHHQPWKAELDALGITEVANVARLNNSAGYVKQIAEVLMPEGQFARIDDPRVISLTR